MASLIETYILTDVYSYACLADKFTARKQRQINDTSLFNYENK
jgi:hypothetical protein